MNKQNPGFASPVFFFFPFYPNFLPRRINITPSLSPSPLPPFLQLGPVPPSFTPPFQLHQRIFPISRSNATDREVLLGLFFFSSSVPSCVSNFFHVRVGHSLTPPPGHPKKHFKIDSGCSAHRGFLIPAFLSQKPPPGDLWTNHDS